MTRPLNDSSMVLSRSSAMPWAAFARKLAVAGATTTNCHRFTGDLEPYVRDADIVVVAVGKPGIVRGEWIKDGATVIDVGITRGADGKLVGDVDFEAAARRAAWITPVPGGVGPMTIACLLMNTYTAACRAAGLAPALPDA